MTPTSAHGTKGGTDRVRPDKVAKAAAAAAAPTPTPAPKASAWGDDLSYQQWDMHSIFVPRTHAHNIKGKGVKVRLPALQVVAAAGWADASAFDAVSLTLPCKRYGRRTDLIQAMQHCNRLLLPSRSACWLGQLVNFTVTCLICCAGRDPGLGPGLHPPGHCATDRLRQLSQLRGRHDEQHAGGVE